MLLACFHSILQLKIIHGPARTLPCLLPHLWHKRFIINATKKRWHYTSTKIHSHVFVRVQYCWFLVCSRAALSRNVAPIAVMQTISIVVIYTIFVANCQTVFIACYLRCLHYYHCFIVTNYTVTIANTHTAFITIIYIVFKLSLTLLSLMYLTLFSLLPRTLFQLL